MIKKQRLYKRKIRLARRYEEYIKCAYVIFPDEVGDLRLQYLKKRKRMERRLIVVEPEEESYFLGIF